MSEKLYDTTIAPKLKEVSKLCEQYGMNFIATCEYDREHFGTTSVMPDPGITMRMIAWATAAKGNFDLLTIKVSRYVKSACPSHNSMVLKILEDEKCSSREIGEGEDDR